MQTTQSKYTANAIESEKAVLGSILLDNSTLSIAAEMLKEEDFSIMLNADIFKTMKALDKSNQPVNLATLYQQLCVNSQFMESGDVRYLQDMMTTTSTASLIEKYCANVANDSNRRRINRLALEIESATQNPIADTSEYIQSVKDRLDDISANGSAKPWQSFRDVSRNALQNIIDAQKGNIVMINTGFLDLDNELSGLRAGSLTIVAARPGMGKTAFAMNIVKYVSVDKKTPVAFFSLEMTADELCVRLLSQLSNVSSKAIRNGTMNQSEWDRVFTSVEKYNTAPIQIDSTPGISIGSLRDRARRLKSENNIGLIVIDYLQLMTSEGKRINSREQEVADISRRLKGLAKELNVPVMCLAQLNRAVDSRADKRPILPDLRESGSIEQDADNILFIHREDYYERDKQKTNKAEIIIAKQRAGQTGIVNLHWDGPTTTFSNYSEEY